MAKVHFEDAFKTGNADPTPRVPTLYVFESVTGGRDTFFIADGDEPSANTGENPTVYADQIPFRPVANVFAASHKLLAALQKADDMLEEIRQGKTFNNGQWWDAMKERQDAIAAAKGK